MSNEPSESDEKPELRKAVRVWLENGTRLHAMWVGDRWWSIEGEISPTRWEMEERPKKTRKISETLPPELVD